MGKLVEKAYFTMRYQVLGPDYTPVRNSLNLGDQDVGRFFKEACKLKAPADIARALRGLYPTQNRLEYSNNSQKEQKEQYGQSLPRSLHAVDREAWNVWFYETASWIAIRLELWPVISVPNYCTSLHCTINKAMSYVWKDR